MSSIAELMRSYEQKKALYQLNGSTATGLTGVHFFRSEKGNARQPLLYQSGIIIVGQGYKIIHLGDQQVRYGAGDYLVLGVPLPLECEAYSEDGQPILGLAIDVETQLLHKLVNQLHQTGYAPPGDRCAPECGLKSAKLDAELENACARLLQTLHNDRDTAILGKSIVTEIIYRILTGPQGHTLFGLAQHDGHYARIARALTRVHQDYAAPLTVDSLAEDVNMSVSSFHRAFRQVTLESPLQYLKKVRLAKAKDLIMLEGKRAADAARLVGYTSPSQFNREFKRHFQLTPGMVSTAS